MMLAAMRGLLPYHQAVVDGSWRQDGRFCLNELPILDLRGKTLGIVGIGNIGKRVTEIARGQMHLCLFDSINYDLRPWLRAGDTAGLIAQLHQLIAHKPEHHHLHEQNPGIMRHLAQIGG